MAHQAPDHRLSQPSEMGTVAAPEDAQGAPSSPPLRRPDEDADASTKHEANQSPSAADDTEDQAHYPSSWRLALITTALCLALFCFALDNTILATAVPRITDEFHALNDIGWYGSSYMLTSCSFQLLFGKIYALYPTKPVFLTAMTLFELGSLICGVAPTSTALIVGRAIAGLGAAGIMSGAMLVVAESVPLRRRPIYAGLVGAMFGIANVAGPLLGGVFTDAPGLTWRWCFYINLPFGGVTILFILIGLAGRKDKRKENKMREKKGSLWEQVRSLDLEGTLVFLPAVICLLLALQWGGAMYPWSDGRVIALFVVFGVLLGCFVGIQYWKGDRATVPPRIFLNRNVLACAAFGFCFGASFFPLTYYIPIWFQSVKGASAIKSGIMNLPILLSLVVAAVVAGGLITAVVGYYTPFVYLSTVLMSIGAGLLTTFRVDTPASRWIGYQVVYGFGVGLGMQQPIIAIQAALPEADIAIGTAVLMFVQQLAGAVFISVTQNVFANLLVGNLSGVAGLDSKLVLALGATQIREKVPEEYLGAVLAAYNEAITRTWYVAVATAAATAIGALGIEWRSVKEKKTDGDKC